MKKKHFVTSFTFSNCTIINNFKKKLDIEICLLYMYLKYTYVIVCLRKPFLDFRNYIFQIILNFIIS